MNKVLGFLSLQGVASSKMIINNNNTVFYISMLLLIQIDWKIFKNTGIYIHFKTESLLRQKRGIQQALQIYSATKECHRLHDSTEAQEGNRQPLSSAVAFNFWRTLWPFKLLPGSTEHPVFLQIYIAGTFLFNSTNPVAGTYNVLGIMLLSAKKHQWELVLFFFFLTVFSQK